MGNGQSTDRDAAQAKTRERSGSTRDSESATAPSTIKKRTSIRRNRQVLTSSSPPPQYRKGSADTTESTSDQADKLSLLDEPGSSVPQAHSRRASITSSVPEEVERDQDDDPSSTVTKIATTIKWSGKGQKVYLTGSFTQWRKKISMKKEEGECDFTIKLFLTPGTHRLKFNVDGEWKTNENMAVATDSSGNFVNYIEVLPSESDLTLTRTDEAKEATDFPARRREENWTNTIPSFMTPSEELLQSPAMIPPSLPPHLEKVILNTSNERKDDHSILPHPNHVVLNHLAASSIRNGVLAVSASTRYRKKYVTTIYQTAAPTSTTAG